MNTTTPYAEQADLTTWGDLGFSEEPGPAWYDVADAREKPQPIRVVSVQPTPSVDRAECKFKTYARLEVERIDGARFLWDVTSWRAWCALRTVKLPREWFTVQSKGSGTDRVFRAAQGTAPPEGPWIG